MFRINAGNSAESVYQYVPSDNTVTNPQTRAEAPIPMAGSSSDPGGDTFVRTTSEADDNVSASQVTDEPPVADEPPVTDEPPVADTPPAKDAEAQQMLDNNDVAFADINKFLDDNENEISPDLKAKLAAKAAQIIIDTEDLPQDDSDAIDILNRLVEYKAEYEGEISDDIITDKLLDKLYKKLGIKPKPDKPVKLPVKRTPSDTPYRFQPRLYPYVDLSLQANTNLEVTSAVHAGEVTRREGRRDDAFYEYGAGVAAEAAYGFRGPQFKLGGYGMFDYKRVLSNDSGQSAGVTVQAEAVYTNGVSTQDMNPGTVSGNNVDLVSYSIHSETPYQGYEVSATVTPYYSFDRLPFDNSVSFKISTPVGVNYEKRDGQPGEVAWNAALMTSMTGKRSGVTVDMWAGLQSLPYSGSMDHNLFPNAGVGIHWNLPTSVETNIDRARVRRKRGGH